MHKDNVYNYKEKYVNGFTFVELIVSIGILLILVGLIVFVLNPLKQINKAFDGRRLADLSSFTSVFETYYNDHQHFPTSVLFGSVWQEGSTIYLSKTPQDPQGTNNNGGYVYMTDGSTTPQWAVMFSKLSNANSSATTTCELSPSCAPAGYIPSQWACKVYGTVSCSSITTQSLPGTTIVSQATQQNSGSTTTTTSSSSTNQNSMTQVTLCHYNSSNNYTQQTTGATSDVGGHDGHPNDIIPPFTYSCTSGTCSYIGKNWTTQNQQIYNNKCSVEQQTQGYHIDDTKFLQTYIVLGYTYPGFPPDWMIDVSFRPDFGGKVQVGMDGFVPNPINADTILWAAYAASGTFGSPTSTSETAEDTITSKYVAFISHPYTWTQYVNGCGKTIYWRVSNIIYGIPGVDYDSTMFSPVFSNTVDCTTKVGAFSTTGASPLNWYDYYSYINPDDTVKQGEPYNSTMDANGDGIINWVDYAILSWSTKMRAGGWQPPE